MDDLFPEQTEFLRRSMPMLPQAPAILGQFVRSLRKLPRIGFALKGFALHANPQLAFH